MGISKIILIVILSLLLLLFVQAFAVEIPEEGPDFIFQCQGSEVFEDNSALVNNIKTLERAEREIIKKLVIDEDTSADGILIYVLHGQKENNFKDKPSIADERATILKTYFQEKFPHLTIIKGAMCVPVFSSPGLDDSMGMPKNDIIKINRICGCDCCPPPKRKPRLTVGELEDWQIVLRQRYLIIEKELGQNCYLATDCRDMPSITLHTPDGIEWYIRQLQNIPHLVKDLQLPVREYELLQVGVFYSHGQQLLEIANEIVKNSGGALIFEYDEEKVKRTIDNMRLAKKHYLRVLEKLKVGTDHLKREQGNFTENELRDLTRVYSDWILVDSRAGDFYSYRERIAGIQEILQLQNFIRDNLAMNELYQSNERPLCIGFQQEEFAFSLDSTFESIELSRKQLPEKLKKYGIKDLSNILN